MPQIIVTAGDTGGFDGTVMLRERINVSDFESERFTSNLVERLGWAVDDAAEVEQQDPEIQGETDQPKEAETAPELVRA